jgi:hypothetical protein
MIQNIDRIGDILAIPFFAILSFYFIYKKNKTNLEIVLMLFVIIAFFADIYFSYLFFHKNYQK